MGKKKNLYPDCPDKVSKPIIKNNRGYCEMNISFNEWVNQNITVLGISFLLERNVKIIVPGSRIFFMKGNDIYFKLLGKNDTLVTLEQASIEILKSNKIMFKKRHLS